MTTDPLISVLIPAYNRASTLEQCVRPAAASGTAFTDAIPSTRSIDCNRRAIGCDSLMVPEPLCTIASASRRATLRCVTKQPSTAPTAQTH